MKIIWSNFASFTLKEIFDYYSENAGQKVARKIKSKIFKATKPLQEQPHIGQIELSLEKLNQGHRYIVEGNYKIVYREVQEGILISDIFDCRQDPIKINNHKRNK